MGLRRPMRSEIQPVPSFRKLAAPSALPSIHPRTPAGTPIACRKPGSTTVTISCPTSDRKLVMVIPTTSRLSHCGTLDRAAARGQYVSVAGRALEFARKPPRPGEDDSYRAVRGEERT